MSETRLQVSLLTHKHNRQQYLSVTNTDSQNELFDLNTTALKARKQLKSLERNIKCFNNVFPSVLCSIIVLIVINVIYILLKVKEINDYQDKHFGPNNCDAIDSMDYYTNGKWTLSCSSKNTPCFENHTVCHDLERHVCIMNRYLAIGFIVFCINFIFSIGYIIINRKNISLEKDRYNKMLETFWENLYAKNNIVLRKSINHYFNIARHLTIPENIDTTLILGLILIDEIDPQQLVNFLAILNVLNQEMNRHNDNGQQTDTTTDQNQLIRKNTETQVILYEMQGLLRIIIEYCGYDKSDYFRKQ